MVKALYYEVNTSVFAACRKLRFLIGRACLIERWSVYLWLAEGY